MTYRWLTVVLGLIALSLLSATTLAQNGGTPRKSWGDPDLEGIWTNATLTTFQRSPELGTKEFFTPEESAAFEKQRIQQTNADRPLRPGEVGAYNDAFSSEGKPPRADGLL